MHSATLKHISLSKNKVPNTLMKAIADGIPASNAVERIDLLHVKEARNINWPDLLKDISRIA
jgi:hypothetical protein